MTKNPRRSLAAAAALAPVTLAGCSLATGATPVQPTPASRATVAATPAATVTVAAPPEEPACHLNWGSRFLLNQPAGALFACYGQNLPALERTLGYGSTWSVTTITCDSESVGMTCTNSNTGHYFFISRQTWRLG
jgi:hypothetical protein